MSSEDGKIRPPLPDAEEIAGLPPDGGPIWNRLVFESSPYLLQHAANPVDWFPWGEEAFAKAVAEDKPIFLSIGYATCHWCHVMEHESFEDEEVAALLNKHFICIKADKEERPDIDDIYMNACQVMNGHGGWPLTIMLTHDKKPFFTGTYFPKDGHGRRIGMMRLIPHVISIWKNDRERLLESASQITTYLQEISVHAPGDPLDATTLHSAFNQLEQRYDEDHGGFGSAPKFPTPHQLSFLLRYARRAQNEKAIEMVSKTLMAMRHGGIFDQVGFGFHRYSTDEKWLLPHFEKMLYDQAMIAIAYLEAYQTTGKPIFARTAREIFTYVLRDLTAPKGGFYSAEDADSEGVEGKFYYWRPTEIRQILGSEEGAFYCEVYQITEEGNFLEEATGHRTGDNIPHPKYTLSALAESQGVEEYEIQDRLEAARRKLFHIREERIRPFLDDKILTDWNGLMIAALALGARVLGESRYAEAAAKAAGFLLDHLRDEDGYLLKRYRSGKAGLAAHLDDYAFVTWGLIELYQADFDKRWLEAAIDLHQKTLDRFADPKSGAFFLTSEDNTDVILRGLRIYDGAVPSGNSVIACNALKLARLTGNESWTRMAEQIMTAFAAHLRKQPITACQLLCALDFLIGPSQEIVIAGEREEAKPMLSAIESVFLPNKVVILRDSESGIEQIAPFTQSQLSVDDQVTAYVCRDYSCSSPTTDIDQMMANISSESQDMIE